MGKWRTKLFKTDRARDFDHERDRHVRARQVYETIDRQPFQWMVVLVAGIGFFLDGYTLFASNIALPMISYVYWNDETSHDKLTWINTATLAGTLVGQISFGVLADQKGRKRMYGLELIVLVISTLGVVMCSTGTHNSMSIFAWLIIWRFVAGIGVGADYPLSAVITSEFAPTSQRARMMATVFFMQPLGQIASNLASMLIVILTRRAHGTTDLMRSVDIMWRWVIGVGVFPGVLAILLRYTIPETPRFTLEIKDDPVKAEFDATELFGDQGDEEELVSPVGKELEAGTWMLDTKGSLVHKPSAASILSMSNISTSHTYYDDFENSSPTSVLATADWTLTSPRLPTLNSDWSRTRADLYQYFIQEGNYRTLLAVSVSWLMLDFGFYGIGLSSPQFLAKTWGTLSISDRRPPWQITEDLNVNIYETFLNTSLYALVILNLGSFVGGTLLIATINRLNRVTLQKAGFLVLAAIFVAMGTVFLVLPQHRSGPVAISLYVIAQLVFNFGPNATTYILPAEIFPTRYRATCHGIAAASGKFGSILMQIIGVFVARRHEGPNGPEEAAVHYGKILIGFSGAMVIGFVASMWLPQVQEPLYKKGLISVDDDSRRRRFKKAFTGIGTKSLRSKTLEELSLGRAGHRSASAVRRSGW